MRIPHLIDGKAVASRECFETLNPALYRAIAHFFEGR